MLRRVALVRTDVSEEFSASVIRVTRIGELGTATFLVHLFLSPWWWWREVPPKCRFLQESHGVTFQKTPFFMHVFIHSLTNLHGVVLTGTMLPGHCSANVWSITFSAVQPCSIAYGQQQSNSERHSINRLNSDVICNVLFIEILGNPELYYN
jgi:hypothetical protein